MAAINIHNRENKKTLESTLKADWNILSNNNHNLSEIPASPCGLIKNGALSEILPVSYRDRIAALGATMAFLSVILRENKGSVIWCQLRDTDRLHLHAPGLAAFGIDPKRIAKVTLPTERDLLWAMEEATTSKAVAAVAGVLWSEKLYGFTASKRLRVRASETGIPVLLVRPHRANGASAADMRFSAASHASRAITAKERPFSRLGVPEWRLNLIKSRGMKPHSDHVRWYHEALHLGMATELGNRMPQSPVMPVVQLQHAG